MGEFMGALVDTIISPATTDSSLPLGLPAAAVSATLGTDYEVPSGVDKVRGRVDLFVVRPLRVSVSGLFFFFSRYVAFPRSVGCYGYSGALLVLSW